MAEPIGEKGIRDVPGIGDVLGAKLSEAGYEKVLVFFSFVSLYIITIIIVVNYSQAFTLFGKYLLCHKNVEEFQDWLQIQCGANSHQARSAAQALSDWADAFI